MQSISIEQAKKACKFDLSDLHQIQNCRGDKNKLGYAYQLAYVRYFNRFPSQNFEDLNKILLEQVALRLELPATEIDHYYKRRMTLSNHRSDITIYGKYKDYNESVQEKLSEHLIGQTNFNLATSVLVTKAEEFLAGLKVLSPTREQIERLVKVVSNTTEDKLKEFLASQLSEQIKKELDKLLLTNHRGVSTLQLLKTSAGRATINSEIRIQENLDLIEATGITSLRLDWLNRNIRRYLYKVVMNKDVANLRRLEDNNRYALLACFLIQRYTELSDQSWNMHIKIMTSKNRVSENRIDKHTKKHKKSINENLDKYRKILSLSLDTTVSDEDLRNRIFEITGKQEIEESLAELNEYFDKRYSDPLVLSSESYSAFRKYTPKLLNRLKFQAEKPQDEKSKSLIEAVNLLRHLNTQGAKKIPRNAPTEFVPKNKHNLIYNDKGEIVRAVWEQALLTQLDKTVQEGTLYIGDSTRYDSLNKFFIPKDLWLDKIDWFFERNKLPKDPTKAVALLANRLMEASKNFNSLYGQEGVSKILSGRLHPPQDPAELFSVEARKQLTDLKDWLQDETRTLSLIEAFVEVNNDLNLTQFFTQKDKVETDPELICQIIATILAYATNTGLYTMARMTKMPYHKLRAIADSFDESNLKPALSVLVKAMLENQVSKNWGYGKTSSSDGQRFPYLRNVLHSVFSNRLREYGGEFYSFVSDNYMPYASMAIECTDKDAHFLVNGITDKESELELEEHYTDTHGYTEINFAYFAMRGISYKPRIKDIHKQKPYTLNKSINNGVLQDILKGNYIDLDNLRDYWQEVAHYFASLEFGDLAPNIGMKRIVNLTEKNKFYRAAKDLGRIFKTIHLLEYHSNPELRKRIKKGLNKGEQIHALGRKLAYGKEGKHSMPSLDEQQNTRSALTLTEAVIIYWQATEMQRIIYERFSGQVCLDMLANISPIEWQNILIYGEYKFDKKLIKIRQTGS